MSSYRRYKKKVLKTASRDPDYAQFVRRRGRVVWHDYPAWCGWLFKKYLSWTVTELQNAASRRLELDFLYLPKEALPGHKPFELFDYVKKK